MLEKILNGAQIRALNIGKNTRAPMEGIFRGVRLEDLSTQRVKSSLSSRPITGSFWGRLVTFLVICPVDRLN